MPTNRLWRYDYKTIRAHTEWSNRSRLLAIPGAIAANFYFKKQKLFAWDIDMPLDRTKTAEKILGIRLEA